MWQGQETKFFEWMIVGLFFHTVQISRVKMAYCAENVCVELDNENTHLYAIGSRSHISFVDDRLSDKVTSVRSLDKDCGKYFHTIDLIFVHAVEFWVL